MDLPFPSPWDLPDLGIKSVSPALWADSLPSEPQVKPIKFLLTLKYSIRIHRFNKVYFAHDPVQSKCSTKLLNERNKSNSLPTEFP